MIGALLFKLMAGSAMKTTNNRDIKKIVSNFKDDAIFVYPGRLSVSGRYEGKEAIEEFFHKFFDQFPEVHFTCRAVYVKNIFAVGLSNTIAIEWENRLTNRNGEILENSGISTTQIKWAKVARHHEYYFDLDTMRKAWGE